jgi:hypothetical protein
MEVIVLIFGSPFYITVKLPEGVSFIGWCKNVKADGGIFANELHIPYDKIAGMGLPGQFKQPEGIQNAPTSETKQ